MSIFATQSKAFNATLENAPTGLVGTLGVTIFAAGGSTAVARTTAGITEIPAGSGIYVAALAAPAATGSYLVVWDYAGTTAEEDLTVLAAGTTIPIGEPYYCTTEELRGELTLTPEVLPDQAATSKIEDAEDIIDRMLGGWFWGPNEQTGRKVTQGDVMPWQWSKLTRATVKLAARLYNDPSRLEQIYEITRGPDFSAQGPKGGALVHIIGVQVLALIDDSGLRRIAGRARQGRGQRIKGTYERFLTATRHDGT